jgi:hypothetical protein
MAHFAEIDGAGTVLRVLVVPNEQESRGDAFLRDDLKLGGVWRQTSYNGNIRKNYAGVGHTYDSMRDAFIAPKPFASWLLDESTCQWQAPIARPTTGRWKWDEALGNWVASA